MKDSALELWILQSHLLSLAEQETHSTETAGPGGQEGETDLNREWRGLRTGEG